MSRILNPSGSSKLVLDVSSSIKTIFRSEGKLLLTSLIFSKLKITFENLFPLIENFLVNLYFIN